MCSSTVTEDLDSLADAQQYIAQIEGLQVDALLKNKVIEDLTNSNSSLQTTVDTQSTTIQTQAKTIEDLTKTRKVYRITTAFLVVHLSSSPLVFLPTLTSTPQLNSSHGILPPDFAGETAGGINQVIQWAKL